MSRFPNRLILVLLGLTAVLASAAAAPPVNIRVWLPGFAVYRDVMVRDFQAGYPEIRLDLVCQDAQGLSGKLLTALVTKTAPDLCLIDLNTLGGLAEAGYCEALDRYLTDLRDTGGINPFLLRMLTINGKARGVMVTGHPLALYIRQDWLTRLGLKPPTTWEDVAQIAEAFTKKDPDGNGKNDTYGLAERWPAADPETARRFLPWLYQAGGLVAANQGGKWVPSFGLSGGAKALHFRRRLWEGGLIPPGAPANTAAQNLALFTSGTAGLLVEDDRCVPVIQQALGTRAASLPLPRDIRQCTVGDGQCFVLLSTSNAKWAAFTFAQWWLSREVQRRLILGWDDKPGGTGVEAGPLVLGPRDDVDPAALLGEPLFAGFVRSLPSISPEPYCPNYAALRLVIARAAAAAMGPERTVEKALATGMEEAAALLGP